MPLLLIFADHSLCNVMPLVAEMSRRLQLRTFL